MSVVIEAHGVSRVFTSRGSGLLSPAERTTALDDVDITVREGRTLAIIGESGSGKSTLVRVLLGLDTADSGGVTVSGRPAVPGRASALRWLRRETGIVLQDPYASLDPLFTVADIIAEPLRVLRIPGDHDALVTSALASVGLHEWRSEQYPHELSGGQRQRVALARALVHGPRILVGDEPLSALDVTVRAQILLLLAELKSRLGLTLLLVSHDIGLVQHLADDIVVMRSGRVVEAGTAETVLHDPRSDYTRLLLSSVPLLPERAQP